MKNKKIYLLTFICILIVSILITIRLAQQKQENRSIAQNASTTLSFSPESSTENPIKKNIGDLIPLDIAINPGNNLVTFVRFQVKYDPTKVIPVVSPFSFTPNSESFPTIIEGPVSDTDTVAASVSVGSDPTKAIQDPTTVGTLNFKAVGGTGDTPTQISFTTLTQVLSTGANTQAGENVLSNTSPAIISINDTPPNTSPTPEPTGETTTLEINLLLHGIGAAGDNPNPDSTLSNKTPIHPQRDVSVTIIDINNQTVGTQSGSVVYNAEEENFITTLNLGPSFPTGNYSLKIKSNSYLQKQAPGIIAIENLKKNEAPQTELIAGDIKNDNLLNILDYNILRDCGYGELEPLPIADSNSKYYSNTCASHEPFRPNTDLNDNGTIDSRDYNLFLRELSVQTGD